jgi:hypothetical protein
MEGTVFVENAGNQLSSDATSRTVVKGSAAHGRENIKPVKQHFLTTRPSNQLLLGIHFCRKMTRG